MSREDLRSSILNHLYFGNYDKSSRDVRAIGIGKLLSVVAANFMDDISEATIKYYHQLLFSSVPSIDIIGDYRSGTEPMRIVSGPDYDLTVHYEAPPAKLVPTNMRQLVASISRSYSPDQLSDYIIRAGVSHAYFESIHPFQDGNGRVGRALINHLLSRGIGFAVPFSLSGVFAAGQDEYYAQLKTASHRLDLTHWLQYFIDSLASAISNADTEIQFLLAKTRFFDQFDSQLSDRQRKVILRLFDAGPAGFDGGLSAKNYERLTRTSKATATRELTDLMDLGALVRTGIGRSTRYALKLN